MSSPCGSNESFVLLANGVHGAAAVQLVHQVLEAPNVFVFGEILQHPNISALEQHQDTGRSYFKLLELFAFGTYRQYLDKVISIL